MPRSAHHPPAVARRLVTATALSLVIAGSQAVPAIADDAPSTPGMVSAGFYDPPAELPAADGALVRTEELPLALSLPSIGGKQLPGTATRLMYKTTDSNGQPAAVTGAYIEPSAPWRGEGPRPMVAVAPGTMGQGDSCSASMGLERPINFDGNSVSVGYEDIAIYRLLAEGAAVVVTDYVGLGTTDRLHTYVNRVDGGHAVLDAVRAARQLPDTSVTPDSRVALYGYSQGGGATASAAELQPDYAPDVPLAGAYVGAPPANLTEVVEGIDGSALVGALGWSLNGFIQAHPELQPVVDEYLNEDGKAALETLSTSCVGDGIARFAFRRSAEWTTTGQTLGEVVEAEPAVRNVLDDQLIGTRKPATAVRVATGVQDDIVPHDQARQLAVDWCDQGGEVTYQPVQIPDLGKGLLTNHITPLLADQTNAISWLTDRLSGAAAINNCNTVPDQP